MKDKGFLLSRCFEPGNLSRHPKNAGLQGVRSFPIHLGVLMQLVMSLWSRVLWCQWKEPFGKLLQSSYSHFSVHSSLHSFGSSKNAYVLSMKTTWLWNFHEFPAFSLLTKSCHCHFLQLNISHPVSICLPGALTINGSTVNVHDSTLTSSASLQLISTIATSGAKKTQKRRQQNTANSWVQRVFFMNAQVGTVGVLDFCLFKNCFWKQPGKHGIPWFLKKSLPFLPGWLTGTRIWPFQRCTLVI